MNLANGLILSACLGLGILCSCSCAPRPAPPVTPHSASRDKILCENAVGPSWIAWTHAALPGANLVYVDRENWDLWTMDEQGGSRNCLTRPGTNLLGVDFPLDGDGLDPAIHWKGDPEAHPTLPIILFKAENENSIHRPLANAPSIGWDNDIWALDMDRKEYYRLTRLAPGQGIQHSALSEDGRWYIFPLRYDKGDPARDFGLSRMVFCELITDGSGRLQLAERFTAEPNGPMYYEPNDIRRNPSGSYTLSYAAGPGQLCDPYLYEWTWDGEQAAAVNTRLQDTPDLHEEFLMFSPAGDKIAWMRGPMSLLRYKADLHVSNPDFTVVEPVTWYNDCFVWRGRCHPDGCQMSRLEWKGDGTAIFFGLWIHEGPLSPFSRTELHRVDFVGLR